MRQFKKKGQDHDNQYNDIEKKLLPSNGNHDLSYSTFDIQGGGGERIVGGWGWSDVCHLFVLPEEILLEIVYSLDLVSVCQLICTSKRLRGLHEDVRIWDNLSHKMYDKFLEIETGPRKKTKGQNAKEQFRQIHNQELDRIHPYRVISRANAIKKKIQSNTKTVANILYYTLQHPFWEIIFFISFFLFFLLVPFYIEGQWNVTGQYLTILLLIPLVQWSLLFFVTMCLMIFRYYINFQFIERSSITALMPNGILFLPSVPLILFSYENKWDKKDYFFFCLYMVLIFSGTGFFGLLALQLLCRCIPWWGVLLPCWLWFFFMGGFISFVLMKEHDKKLDLFYWITGYIGLVTFLIVLGFKIDNLITWRWLYVFIPGMLPTAIWIIYPFHSLFLALLDHLYGYGEYWTELERAISNHNINGTPVVISLWSLGFPSAGLMVLVTLKLDYEMGFSWIIAYVPVFVWLLVGTVGWGLLFAWVVLESNIERQHKIGAIFPLL